MTTTFESKISTVGAELATRLDDLAESLPPVPSKALAATRAGARRVNDVIASTIRSAFERLSAVGATASESAKTASGQAGAQARRVASTARSSIKMVRGQVAAEARQTGTAVVDEIETGLDDAKLAMDPDDLVSLSKSELYHRAQDLDIDGRSSMTKAELVSALQSA